MAKKPNSKAEVTINNDPSQEQLENIRQRAHELYETRGREEGHTSTIGFRPKPRSKHSQPAKREHSE